VTAFTVIGGRGFIGSHLVRHLTRLGYSCEVPDRGQWPAHPGHVIYAAGLTGDFLDRPFETVRAHVSDLATAIQRGSFESFLYLSSTRIYIGLDDSHEEADLRVNPLKPDQLYNLSKLMGESVCVCTADPTVRIARLSNVYGPELAAPMFLDRIIRDAVDHRRVLVRSHPESAKDYIHVDDVTDLLPRISLEGGQPVYNVASGVNVTTAALLSRVEELTGCVVEQHGLDDPVVYPALNIDRIRTEFTARPRALLTELPGLVESYRQTRRAA